MATDSDRTQLQVQSESPNASHQSEGSSHQLQQNSPTGAMVAGEESVPFIERETFEEEYGSGKGPPADRFKLVYLIVLLHGIGMLLPWNTFLTIGRDYYVKYKLNGTDGVDHFPHFFNYLTICAQVPNLLLSFLNLFVVIRGGLYRRIYFTLFVMVCICLVTIAMVFVPTANWTFGFFLFTMATVVLLNSASGVYQNSIWGLVADFPGGFAGAIVLGNNLCGILMAVLYILIIVLAGTNITVAASIYFSLALLTVVLCILSFHYLSKLRFYNYYVQKAAMARTDYGTNILHEEEAEGVVKDNETKKHPPAKTYIAILAEVGRQMFDVWLVFFVTLALFPNVLLKVDAGDVSSETLYQQLAIFLNFNLFAAVGSFFAGYFQWPSPKYLSVPIVLRLVFLPLFWFCNYAIGESPRRFVFIHNEWAFILLITLMAITHGYWSALAMVYAPMKVSESKSQVVGMMSGFFLVLGITSGILFAFAEPSIVYALEEMLGSFM